ncbi:MULTISPECIES: hypothetical protein [unclassified Kitasatospora]
MDRARDGGWAAYAGAEFGVSRSTAYRLLDLAAAAAAAAIGDVVARQAGSELSHVALFTNLDG